MTFACVYHPVRCPLGWRQFPGFPAPADDHLDGYPDLTRHLVRHRATTCCAHVRGASMVEAGIQHGDLIVVEWLLTPTNGQEVVAVVDGEFISKRPGLQNGRGGLDPARAHYPTVGITEDTSFAVRGVVTQTIHSFTNPAARSPRP